jgi:hypothetical protein
VTEPLIFKPMAPRKKEAALSSILPASAKLLSQDYWMMLRIRDLILLIS